MKKHHLTLILAATLGLFAASCGGESDDKKQPPQEAEEPVEQLGFGDGGSQTYTVPSPNELFSIIKESKLPYRDNLVTTDQANYTSTKVQALNFGRITADIAYTASYEKFKESMANFDNLRKIGDDLGISYVFDEFMVNRVKNNMDNPDSLEIISSDSYERIIGLIEENENGSTLAIIAAGGFVESIYILTNLIGDYTEGSVVIQRLADEKLVMENVVDYLRQYEDDQRVKEVLQEMETISTVFTNLKEAKASEDRNQDGKVILGGNRVMMTEDDFNALKDSSTKYRNSFANASQS